MTVPMALSQLLRLLSFASAGTLCFLFAAAMDICRNPANGNAAILSLTAISSPLTGRAPAFDTTIDARIMDNKDMTDPSSCQEKSEERAFAPQDGTLATDRYFDNFKSHEFKSVAFPVTDSALISAASMGTCLVCPGKVPFKKSMVSRREDRGPPKQIT